MNALKDLANGHLSLLDFLSYLYWFFFESYLDDEVSLREEI